MGCTRLKTFPDISASIAQLELSRTGIEEVPWWIVNFSMLQALTMNGCNKLQCVSLHIAKLKHLAGVEFSNCGALTETNWNGSPDLVAMETDYIHSKYFPKVEFSFINCFNLDQEALIQQQSNYFHAMHLSGEEMPSYFTHRTTGTSFTNIPLLGNPLSQKFLKFKACAMVYAESVSIDYNEFGIHVSCQFIDRLGNNFDSAGSAVYFSKIQQGSQVVVFDCRFPLNKEGSPLAEVNYDHVDIQFHLSDDDSEFKLRGCGIRLCEDDGSSDDNDPGRETDYSEDSDDSDHGEECEDSDVETKRSSKRIRIA